MSSSPLNRDSNDDEKQPATSSFTDISMAMNAKPTADGRVPRRHNQKAACQEEQ